VKRSNQLSENRLRRAIRRRFFLILMLFVILYPDTAGERSASDTSAAETIKVYIEADKRIAEMPLETYVTRSVAAEMPASYEVEALKAQALASRTRAIAGHCARFPEANVCTSSACCQAYIDESAMRAKWGGDYAYYFKRIDDAVRATAGEIITYGGKPILVLFHAISGGMTEDVELVFTQALPYLRSVESPGEESASKYSYERTFERKSVADAINFSVKGAKLSADKLESQLKITERSASGRVLSVAVGAKTITGRELRGILGLNSTNFTIAYTPANIIFSELGYGHGVGMSQAGANAMAGGGADYREIITHYYTGVTITP
jgi:stage II sporulation protein D